MKIKSSKKPGTKTPREGADNTERHNKDLLENSSQKLMGNDAAAVNGDRSDDLSCSVNTGSRNSSEEDIQAEEGIMAALSGKRNEKYLKATDFLEVQLANVLTGRAAFTELAKIVLGLIDILDLDKTVQVLYESDMQEVLFTSITLMSWRDGLRDFREQLILRMFTESIARQQMHFALRILAQFKNLIMININLVLPSLL